MTACLSSLTVTEMDGPGDLRVVCEGRTFFVWNTDSLEWSILERGSMAPIVRRPTRATALRYVESAAAHD